MLSSNEIRTKYLEFFKARGHAIIPSASLIPENDPTLLFANSGMFPLVPYLISGQHPQGKRLADSQKSFRMEDIEEVGDNRHNTFFEMLGNWSLGDYFKKEQLNWWYEFLFDELKLDPSRLFQTVYAGDERAPKDAESIAILKDIFARHGIVAEEGPETLGKGAIGPGVEIDFKSQRIFAYRDKNWWQRGDAVGELGGPDSETFYDTGKQHNSKHGDHCHLNCDCGRFLEIGNSVFMQYQKTERGWEPMANKNVDFGGGLERVTMVVQKKDNIFETDLFADIIKKISDLSGKTYRENMSAFEVIADHLKAATFIMGDDKGVAPSNTDQGYIVRRLIRRALRYGRQLGITKTSWTQDVAQTVIAQYARVYPELERNGKFITDEFTKEEEKFSRTLEKGLKQFEKTTDFTGAALFDLFQSYGFPLEMSFEELANRGVAFDKVALSAEFNAELAKHQELSRTASAGKFKGGLADQSAETTRLHTAAHLMLAALRKTLGETVSQKGSNITPERLRFDVSYPEKISPEVLKKVEEMVNEQIKKDLPVWFEEMPIEEARKIGATGVFDSKYGERVKVYFVGKDADNFSKEICGGPHVTHTGELGHFKIAKEESSSAGVRRIKAVLE